MTIGDNDIFDSDGYLDEDNSDQDFVTTDSEVVEEEELGSNLENAIDATPNESQIKELKKNKAPLKKQIRQKLPEKLKLKGVKAMILIMGNGKRVIYA